MVSVFLSHSSRDKPFVRELADFLLREGDIKVWLDEREIAPGQNIVRAIGEGLDADFMLLILSPDSVDSEWVKEEWTDAFWEQTNSRKQKLLGVLYRDCQIPRLLRNKKYFDLQSNQPDGFRAIRTFLLTERPVLPEHVNPLPVRPPLFVGRERELFELRERLRQPGALVHIPGMPGKGKTTLALEFAHRYQQDFAAVYWVPCQSLSLASIAAELTRQLGLKLEGDLAEILRELKSVCANKRCLLILDNVENEEPAQLVPGGAASVLVTTRFSNLRFLNFRQPVAVPLFTDSECFDVFRQQLGAEDVARCEAECRQLFRRLGYLPIGITVSAALIRYDVRYTIAGLSRKLPADVSALIREAVEALEPISRKLLTAMAACAPDGFRLDLSAAVAGLDEEAALNALQHLMTRSLAEEVDRASRRYRLHAMVREAAGGEELARQQAEAVRERFESWETNWRRCEEELPDLQVALEWALKNGGERATNQLSTDLAYLGFLLTKRVGRLTEAFEICQRMSHVAEEEQNKAIWQGWLGNQASVLQEWGRLDEALALLKQQEAICFELRHKNGLQVTYGNQALILQNWGRLDEALALLKQQEAICIELRNKDSLQLSFGNQAVILQDWGRLDEALALLKQQEAICQDLGNRDSLQRSYGNQAIIMRDWGRLDDSLALLRQQEAICLELGNKVSLGICYWNWGRLERQLGHSDGEQHKLAAALALFEDVRMPLQRATVAKELAQSRAAGSS